LRAFLLGAVAASLVATLSVPASGQIGMLKKLVPGGINLPTLRKEPISTSLTDARWSDPTQDDFTPPAPKHALADLKRTPAGGFILQPGYYSFHDQSYCLHAGTYGPGGGDGYLYAPPLGAAKDAVMTIVRNSVQHPEIEQHDIQTLLWAIVARARLEDLSTEHKAIAAQLLPPRQLAALNRSVLDLVSQGPVAENLPREIRQAMQAEADLRRMLMTPGTSFGELERVAVLAGAAPTGKGSLEVPSGRWSHHPDGYWVRYLPVSYSNTVVELWVPNDAPGVGVEFDPATHIAVPGNTARQRLIQSGRAYKTS